MSHRSLQPPFHSGAIVLAAGESRRMGGGAKALLPWGDGTIFSEVAAAVVAGRFTLSVAVLRPDLAGALPGAALFDAIVLNGEPERGQFHSLRLGLERLRILGGPDLAGCVLFLTDNPGRLAERVALLRARAEAAPDRLLTAGHGGRAGHPLWLPRRLWEGIAAWEGPEGLRGFFAATGERPEVVEAGPEALHDLDTPEEYRRARG